MVSGMVHGRLPAAAGVDAAITSGNVAPSSVEYSRRTSVTPVEVHVMVLVVSPTSQRSPPTGFVMIVFVTRNTADSFFTCGSAASERLITALAEASDAAGVHE